MESDQIHHQNRVIPTQQDSSGLSAKKGHEVRTELKIKSYICVTFLKLDGPLSPVNPFCFKKNNNKLF
jgi:hypothetical protein